MSEAPAGIDVNLAVTAVAMNAACDFLAGTPNAVSQIIRESGTAPAATSVFAKLD